MKNFIRIFSCLVILTSACLSCKKDSKPGADLIGKWFLVKGEFNDHRNGTDNKYVEDFPGEDYLQLNADGTLIEYMYGDQLPGTWARNGNTLKLKYEEDGDYNMLIKTLTDSTLVFYYREDIVEGEYDEETYHYKR